MAGPIPYPFYMTKANNPDMLVVDDGGYAAAMSMGYSFSSVIITQTSINAQQPDPLQPIEPS